MTFEYLNWFNFHQDVFLYLKSLWSNQMKPPKSEICLFKLGHLYTIPPNASHNTHLCIYRGGKQFIKYHLQKMLQDFQTEHTLKQIC